MAAVAQIEIVVDDAQLTTSMDEIAAKFGVTSAQAKEFFDAMGNSAEEATGKAAAGQKVVQSETDKAALKVQDLNTAFAALGLGAPKSVQQLTDALALSERTGVSLASALSAVRAQAEAAAPAITGSFYQTRLLATEIGVGMPRAMEQVIARTPVLASAISAAFPVLAAIGFIGIAEQVAEKIAELSLRVFDWDGSLKQSLTDNVALNNALLDQEKHLEGVEEQYALLGLTGIPRFIVASGQATDHAVKAAQAYNDAVAALQKYEAAVNKSLTTVSEVADPATGMVLGTSESTGDPSGAQLARLRQLRQAVIDTQRALEDAGLSAAQAGQQLRQAFSQDTQKKIADITTSIGEQNKAFLEWSTTIQKMQKEDQDFANKMAAEDKAAADKSFDAWNVSLMNQWDAQQKTHTKMLDDAQKFEDQTNDILQKAAIAAAPPWEQAYARIAANAVREMQQAQEQIQRLEDQHIITTEQGEELMAQRVAAIQVQAQQQAVDQMASQMQNFYDAITSGHIGQYFLKQFETMVFRMVAEWVLGMGQMQQSTGGLFSSVLKLFGLGGGGGGGFGIAGIGGTAPFSDGGAAFAQGPTLDQLTGGGGLASSLGGEDAASLAGTAGGVAAAGTTSLVGKIGGALAGVGVGAEAGLGIGNLIAGPAGLSPLGTGLALSGGVGGALIGFALGGPIGALLGGLAGGLLGGLFGGIFGSDAHAQGEKLRKQAQSQIDQIEQSYDTHQTDYASAISQLESLNTQLNKQLKALGDQPNYHGIADAEQHIYQEETQRQQRAAVQFGPAEFETGGYVGAHLARAIPVGWSPLAFAGGGAVPAIVHAGEFVMSRPAVERIGAGNLARMNAGGDGGAPHVHFHLNMLDTSSFKDFISDHTAQAVLMRTIRRAVREGH